MPMEELLQVFRSAAASPKTGRIEYSAASSKPMPSFSSATAAVAGLIENEKQFVKEVLEPLEGDYYPAIYARMAAIRADPLTSVQFQIRIESAGDKTSVKDLRTSGDSTGSPMMDDDADGVFEAAAEISKLLYFHSTRFLIVSTDDAVFRRSVSPSTASTREVLDFIAHMEENLEPLLKIYTHFLLKRPLILHIYGVLKTIDPTFNAEIAKIKKRRQKFDVLLEFASQRLGVYVDFCKDLILKLALEVELQHRLQVIVDRFMSFFTAINFKIMKAEQVATLRKIQHDYFKNKFMIVADKRYALQVGFALGFVEGVSRDFFKCVILLCNDIIFVGDAETGIEIAAIPLLSITEMLKKKDSKKFIINCTRKFAFKTNSYEEASKWTDKIHQAILLLRETQDDLALVDEAGRTSLDSLMDDLKKEASKTELSPGSSAPKRLRDDPETRLKGLTRQISEGEPSVVSTKSKVLPTYKSEGEKSAVSSKSKKLPSYVSETAFINEKAAFAL